MGKKKLSRIKNHKRNVYYNVPGAGDIELSVRCNSRTGPSTTGFSFGVSWGDYGYAGGVISQEDAMAMANHILTECKYEIKAGTNIRPILFSAPMVNAILEGRKTQTRRVIKPQPPEGLLVYGPEVYPPTAFDKYGNITLGDPVYGVYNSDDWGVKCPYGRPDDWLWVRETWWERKDHVPGVKDRNAVRFTEPPEDMAYLYRKRPSIHLPYWAARIILPVENIRVEQLCDITDEDAQAEGVENRREFAKLWDTINAKRGYSWDMNPWVWVVEFRRM